MNSKAHSKQDFSNSRTQQLQEKYSGYSMIKSKTLKKRMSSSIKQQKKERETVMWLKLSPTS